MEYFIMQQDKRLTHLPMIRIPDEISDREQHKDKASPLTLYIECFGLTYQYPDYLLRPFPMIGERIQSVMEKYQRDISFRPVILMDKKTDIQHHYYRITVPEMDVVTAAEFDSRVKDAKIFQVKQLKGKLIVCLDAAESILRREPEGIWFTPVKVSLFADSDE